jgi:2-methylfumaryl-CoA hydratase
MTAGGRIEVGGPYFEDFVIGQVFDDAPGFTLTEGHAALYLALSGDRLRLPLDRPLCEAVTGRPVLLAHPMLVCNVAIGQTTTPSQRVRGNLFYRGLILRRPAFIGDTLRTRTTVVGLVQNRPKPGRAATGMVALEMQVADQVGEVLLHFYRCPMIPCRDPDHVSPHIGQSFDAIPSAIELSAVAAAVPPDWRLSAFRDAVGGAHFAALAPGVTYAIAGRDSVTGAPELVRLTLNQAMAHADPRSSAYGKRLVYGGHTIAVAAAHITRALPNLVTVLAWRSCEHTAPVFEGDILRSEVTVVALHPLADGGMVDLAVRVFAERGPQAPEAGTDILVLDWQLVGLMA